MSDDGEGAAAPRAGASRDEDTARSVHDGGDDPLMQLQSQISELSKKHDDVMSTIANFGNAQARSIIYIPREKQIVPFSGELGKDCHTVDEFVDEVERVMRARGLSGEDQVDFVLSLLKGSALEEVKLRMGGQAKQPSDLFSYLRAAFREKRTTPQLLHAFYARQQSEGEDLRDYSHALSQLLNAALQQSPSIVADAQLVLRDQFIEGVRDPTLRRELRRLVREKPGLSLFDIREEAIMWTFEDHPRAINTARNRNLVSSGRDEITENANATVNTQKDLTSTLQEVVKIIAQQGKAISELTDAVRGLTMQNANPGSSHRGGRPQARPKYTSDGQPICLRCEGVGHMARQCTTPSRSPGQASAAPRVQGNGNPPLQ